MLTRDMSKQSKSSTLSISADEVLGDCLACAVAAGVSSCEDHLLGEDAVDLVGFLICKALVCARKLLGDGVAVSSCGDRSAHGCSVVLDGKLVRTVYTAWLLIKGRGTGMRAEWSILPVLFRIIFR